jgi:hypothetical protein
LHPPELNPPLLLQPFGLPVPQEPQPILSAILDLRYTLRKKIKRN